MSTNEEALIGTFKVSLSNGSEIELRPWGWKTAKSVIGRVRNMLGMAATIVQEGGGFDVGLMVERHADEVLEMISASTGISTEDLEDETKHDFGDILLLANGVIRVNFVDRPGAKNLLTLFETLEALMPKDEAGEQGTTETPATSTPKSSST